MWKGILYTFLALFVVLFIVKALIWLLPIIIILGVAIYLYGKYKLNKATKEINNEINNRNFKEDRKNKFDVEDVIDVDYKDV
ncbi:putative membrane protein [Clostridium bornimense]|uniref:Putative membrane protein n=1 Tax=Clostridium bornimense TaxID=1216932 RepID=W6S3Z8_9CLOT|nr:hypothetical protein [Clostridium bornimense]CDM69047.1 putative membrane protein [Clostridium bornimense]